MRIAGFEKLTKQNNNVYQCSNHYLFHKGRDDKLLPKMLINGVQAASVSISGASDRDAGAAALAALAWADHEPTPLSFLRKLPPLALHGRRSLPFYLLCARYIS